MYMPCIEVVRRKDSLCLSDNRRSIDHVRNDRFSHAIPIVYNIFANQTKFPPSEAMTNFLQMFGNRVAVLHIALSVLDIAFDHDEG